MLQVVLARVSAPNSAVPHVPQTSVTVQPVGRATHVCTDPDKPAIRWPGASVRRLRDRTAGEVSHVTNIVINMNVKL